MSLLMETVTCLILLLVMVEAQFQSGFEPITGSYDTKLSESRIKPRYSERPSKRQKFRFPDSSEEINHHGKDDDDIDNYRSYTVGAHFQVSHPSTYISRKNTRKETHPYDPNNQKPFSFTNFQLSTDSKYKEPSSSSSSSRRQTSKPKIHKKPIFKASRPEPIDSSSSSEYEDYGIPLRTRAKKYDHFDYDDNSDESFIPSRGALDQDPRKFKGNFKLQKVPNLYQREKQFRGVASKSQIEKYLEDQQKYIDEAIQLQLLNDPSPNARGKYHQFLKSKDDERIEREYEEELKKRPQSLFKSNQPKRYTSVIDRKKTTQSSKKIQSPPGLGHYRTPKADGAYSFNINI